ncbi:hypothetical protein NKR23_g2733 [Pleurostoma richardsiae]|uniref:G-patch domain-containing protein n=1 Tax=Pleurostoma richardsiae TaxID=41990 RepID=A0AA38RPD4_9PEZI|nr:hypothetical protein NKR23_g2733 [Pleurostoma richardsiae]
MNAHALLTAQGWRGKGHSLHASDDSIGLARPILVSRKNDTRGIGKKSHATSDQWWLNAFDEQLKSMEVSATKGVVVTAAAATKLESIAAGTGKYRGLYSRFVRGGLLDGTLTPSTESESTDTTPGPSEDATPSAETEAENRKETKEERRARKEARRRRKTEKEARKVAGEADTPSVKSDDSATKTKKDRKSAETKEERRARKEVKRNRREEKQRQRDS